MEQKIAAVLVDYKGLDLTLKAIGSLKASKVPMGIIVVDNDPLSDDTERIKEIYPDTVLIRSKENLGFSGGNNLGVKRALKSGYDYVLLVNNDTEADPDMAGELLKYAGPDTVTAPLICYFKKPDTVWSAGGWINKRTGNAKHFLMDKKAKNLKLTQCSFLTGCCVMIHKSVFEKVGLLDESYFMYCEDTDYSLRLQEAGVKMLMVPSAKLWHKVGMSAGGNDSAFSIYYQTRNRLLVIKKFKKHFRLGAYSFSVLSRLVRMIQYKHRGNKNYRAFLWGIEDARGGVTGKSARDLSAPLGLK